MCTWTGCVNDGVIKECCIETIALFSGIGNWKEGRISLFITRDLSRASFERASRRRDLDARLRLVNRSLWV